MAAIWGEILGTITDSASGQPIPAALVQVWTEGMATPAQTGTDENGKYAFYNLAPATYSLEYLQYGYLPLIVNGVNLGSGQIKQVNQALTAGQGPLPPFPPIPPVPPPPPDSLSGTVMNANTLVPIAYASLELQSPSLPSGIALGVVSNENGVYLFQDLPAGTYELWCAASAYQTFNQSGIEVTATASTILNIPMKPS